MNLAEIRILEDINFLKEGVMVAAGEINGEFNNIVLYGMNSPSRQ